jgi:hypothetical protein
MQRKVSLFECTGSTLLRVLQNLEISLLPVGKVTIGPKARQRPEDGRPKYMKVERKAYQSEGKVKTI